MLYLFLGLKIPLLLLYWLVYWAIKAGAGARGHRRRRRFAQGAPAPAPTLPRSPRRGPHGDPLPLPPPRVRPVTPRSRVTDR